MSLSDVMSAMKLTVFPQIALVIFLLTFAAILIRVCTYPRSEIHRRSRLPLDEKPDADGDDPSSREKGGHAHG